MVTKHYLTGGYRQILSDLECLGTDRFFPTQRPFLILHEIHPTLQEVLPALLDSGLQDLRIGKDEIGRQKHIEQLARQETHRLLVTSRNAANVGHRIVEELLIQKERLVDQVERPTLPCLIAKSAILRQGLDDRRRFRIERRPCCVHRKPGGLALYLLEQLRLLTG